MTPWNWLTLDPDELREAWVDVRHWVDWMANTYEVRDRIPECWWRHPGLVAEMVALRFRWYEVYALDEAGAEDVLRWHDWLRAVLAGPCATQMKHQGKHDPPSKEIVQVLEQKWNRSEVEFDSYIEAEVAARALARPPSPPDEDGDDLPDIAGLLDAPPDEWDDLPSPFEALVAKEIPTS